MIKLAFVLAKIARSALCIMSAEMLYSVNTIIEPALNSSHP